MKMTLQDRVTRALHDELHAPYDEPWDECPQEFRDRYEFMAMTALTALGLDDLDAAVWRAAEAVTDDDTLCEADVHVARRVLEAALTATKPDRQLGSSRRGYGWGREVTDWTGNLDHLMGTTAETAFDRLEAAEARVAELEVALGRACSLLTTGDIGQIGAIRVYRPKPNVDHVAELRRVLKEHNVD